MEKRFLRLPAQAEAMTRNPNKRRERVEVAIIKAMTVTHFISAKLQVCCLNFNAALKSMFASNTTDSRCRSSGLAGSSPPSDERILKLRTRREARRDSSTSTARLP